jgi:purine-binding chemotaxis protein CheW
MAEITSLPSHAGGAVAANANANRLEVVTFTLGAEEYGIDIQKVQELRGYDAVTRIANAPDYIKGVVNLRGIIVPIIDMRIKFALGTPSYDQFTVVIVLGTLEERMLILVDIDRLMSSDEMGLIEKMAA